MRFVVKPARRGLLRRAQWCFLIVADNGEPIATSETYSNRGDAIATAELIRAQAADATIDAH